MTNAMWSLTFKVADRTQPIASAVLNRYHMSQDGAGWRGHATLSSADLAKPKAAVKRACDTLRARLIKAGVRKTAIVITSCRCVG